MAMNNNSTKVKAYLCEDKTYAVCKEVRLAVITDITYANLVQKLGKLFPDLNNASFSISWIDEDNDIITVSSEEELQQALVFISGGTFKIFLKKDGPEIKPSLPQVKLTPAQQVQNKTPAPETSQTTAALPLQEVHPNIVCDGCNGRVVGPRFKCLICDDYDLCQSCISKNTHYDHDMIRIVAPTKVSATRNWFKPIQHIWHKMARHSASIDKREEKYMALMEHIRQKRNRKMQRKCGKKMDASDKATAAGQKDCSEKLCPDFILDNPFLLDFEQLSGFHDSSDKQKLLKTIGTSVANLLDPLGINVTIDVENSDGEIEPCASCPSNKDDKESKDEQPKLDENCLLKQAENMFKQFQTMQSTTNSTEAAEKPKDNSQEPISIRNILSNIRDMSGNLYQHMQSLQPDQRQEFLRERMTEVQGIMCEVLSGLHPQNVEPEPAKDEKKEETKTKEAAKTETTESRATDVVKPAAEDTKQVEQEATAIKTAVEDSAKATGAIPKRPSYPESSKPSEDMMEFPENEWTLLNKESSPVKEAAAEGVPLVRSDSAVSSSSKIYPDLSMDDEKYSLALNQMIHMGYSNEGQWLLPLIKAKNGDIAAILEVLHPSSA